MRMRTENTYIHKGAKYVGMALTALSLVCMLLGAWAGYIDPAVWAVPAMLCLVFPVLWLMSLGAVVLWLWLSRNKAYAVACGVALLASLPTLLAVSPLRFPEGLRPGETELKLLTYNVAHFKDLELGKTQGSRTLSYIIHSGADVVCMQELYSLEQGKKRGVATQAQIDSVQELYPYRIMTGLEEEVLLSKYPAVYVDGYKEDARSYFNYQVYRLDVCGRQLTLVNVHMPSYRLTKDQRTIASHLKHHPGDVLDSEENATLYRKLRVAFEQRAEAARQLRNMTDTIKGPLIICGDFNDVPGSYAWRTMRSGGMDDAYCQTGKGPMITFNANHLLFHIDQVLYRPDCGVRPLGVSRGSLKSSDHYPVMARFALDPDEMK